MTDLAISAGDHTTLDTQRWHVAGGSSFDRRQRPSDTHASPAAVEPFPEPPDDPPVPNGCSAAQGPSVSDMVLAILADALDDFERTRIATENRLRALRQVKGHIGSVEEQRLESVLDGLRALEHGVELQLRRAMRAHPLGPWVKAQRGIGEKQAARLLAAIGDPYIRPEQVDLDSGEVIKSAGPRTVSQLWALCGYHVVPAQSRADAQDPPGGDDHLSGDHPGPSSGDPQIISAGVAARRRKGQKANWNGNAKMRAYLVAESCMKAGGPYRAVYDARRSHTAITHPDWAAGHSHNDALRVVAKTILRDLWREAKRLHEAT